MVVRELKSQTSYSERKRDTDEKSGDGGGKGDEIEERAGQTGQEGKKAKGR